MENGTLRFLKKTVMTITVLGLALVAASSAGIVMTGYANAQSPQGSAHACPPGYTLTQGQCIAPPITFACPTGTPFVFSIVGTRCTSEPVGAAHLTAAQSLQSICVGLGGHAGTTPDGTAFIVQCFDARLIPVCPGGITPTNGQCITRPGQGGQEG